MGPIKTATALRIHSTLAKSLGVKLDREVRRKFYNLVPRSVWAPDGRIIEGFLPYIAQRAVEVFPGKVDAEELIHELKRENLTAYDEELGNVYQAILKEHETALRVIESRRKLRRVNKRLLHLQNLVRELGVDPRENREIATRCIREALGFSGVRVYTVDLEKGTWFHRLSGGEEGLSRFESPKAPKDDSEKGFLNKLLHSDISLEEIKQAKEEGLFEWHLNGKWGYFYIPDRGRCPFVDMEQLRRDEEGDQSQERNGYGGGGAREDLYLIFGEKGKGRIEVYMITNWAAKKPLFIDKKEDLELLHTFAASLSRANELASAYQRLHDTSLHDELTGVFNRRYFFHQIEKEFARAERYGHPLSLLMVDIDNFKRTNDSYGHPAGDEVLKEVAEAIGENLRENIDTLARYGGEEFVAILPVTNGGVESAYEIAERCRVAVQKASVEIDGEEVNATISIGIATYPRHVSTYEELINRADKALYQAKYAGRNRTVIFQED